MPMGFDKLNHIVEICYSFRSQTNLIISFKTYLNEFNLSNIKISLISKKSFITFDHCFLISKIVILAKLA